MGGLASFFVLLGFVLLQLLYQHKIKEGNPGFLDSLQPFTVASALCTVSLYFLVYATKNVARCGNGKDSGVHSKRLGYRLIVGCDHGSALSLSVLCPVGKIRQY